jgi:hypothetical protein
VRDELDEIAADLGGEAVEQAALRRDDDGPIAAGVAGGTSAALLIAARLERQSQPFGRLHDGDARFQVSEVNVRHGDSLPM